MEQKDSVWKANLTNGLIIGLLGIVYSLVIYFFDLSLNKIQGYVFMVILVIVLFFLVKSYRDNYSHGMITFGQALGAGLIIFLYYSLIMAVFTYILYAVIDPDLSGKMLAGAEEQMLKKGIPQEQVDAGMAIQAKIMKPPIMALIGILSSMFTGFIISLLVAAFVRKEGNPLVDSTIQ